MSDFQGCYRQVFTSAVNTQNVVTIAAGKAGRLTMVLVTYSASTTQNITVVLDNGAGPAYDVTLNTIAISAGTQGIYLPATPIPFNADDQIVVTAPALAAQTSSIAVYVNRLA